MFTDAVVTLGCGSAAIIWALHGNLFSAFIWAGLSLYGLVNYTNNKLRGSKYDY